METQSCCQAERGNGGDRSRKCQGPPTPPNYRDAKSVTPIQARHHRQRTVG